MKYSEMRDRIAANIFNKPEQSKMTRTEAHAKLFARSTLEGSEVDAFINNLEVLGLIKFEKEEVSELVSSPRPVEIEHRIRDTSDACLKFLTAIQHGYKVDYYIKQLKNCLGEW
jgi:hypothetical protein